MFLSLQMTGVFNFLTCVIHFIVGSLAVDVPMSVCSTWKSDHDSVNNLDASLTLWERNDCPIIDCAILCDKDPLCRSFFQHPSLEKCLASSSYKRGLPTDQATQQGWNYYTKTQHCDEGYVFNQSLGLCYKLHSVYKNVYDAMITCEEEGAKLMIIRNEADFRYIQEVMNKALTTSIFIGLRAMGANREWKWWNGQAAAYTPWLSNQPDNYLGIESCVEIIYNGYNDIPCSVLKYFGCQKLI